MRAVLRDRRADIRAYGLELVAVQQNGHYRLTVRAPDGRTGILIASATPSCRRTRAQFLADCRRFAEGRA